MKNDEWVDITPEETKGDDEWVDIAPEQPKAEDGEWVDQKEDLGFWERKRLELEAKTGNKTSMGELALNKTVGLGIDELSETVDEYSEQRLMKGEEDNPLKMAPHTQDEVCADSWNHAYSRTQAAFPLEWIREKKLWPAVSRVDNGYGDRNLVTNVE